MQGRWGLDGKRGQAGGRVLCALLSRHCTALVGEENLPFMRAACVHGDGQWHGIAVCVCVCDEQLVVSFSPPWSLASILSYPSTPSLVGEETLLDGWMPVLIYLCK